MSTTKILTPNYAPPLTAKLAPWMKALSQRAECAVEWLQHHGSPLHVVVPGELGRNARDLLGAMEERGVSGGLYFARKANKLRWFAAAAKDAKLGIDVASWPELEETLKLGVAPEKIVVTAIGKDEMMIRQAATLGCLIVIDNADELDILESISASNALRARIAVRFSGFEVGGRVVFSRFGFPVKDAAGIFERLSHHNSMKLELLHAHLDRYDIDERAGAARTLLELADLAKTIGHNVESIDLGGGILMRYLDDAKQWQEFTESLRAAAGGDREPFTYLDDGLGYYKAADEVLGRPDLYPAWNELSKERFIAAILDHQVNGTPLHKEITGRGMRLYFEPGRALLDNAGVTLSTVTFRKRDTLGNLLVGAAMNRFNLRPFRAEFPCDPIFLSNGEREAVDEGAFIAGNLCSESDVIYRRKIRLTALPKPGDAILFPNTAGYLAHHLEVGTHGNPLPANALLDPCKWEIRDVC